ncbi:unnamed protein product, partial [Strongylus vulgaris]
MISDTDLLACCGAYCGDGCDGGYTVRGWNYFITSGLCTGGDYGDKYTWGFPLGGHAVKVIGWGVDKGVDY